MTIPQKRLMMLDMTIGGAGAKVIHGNPAPTRIPRALQRRASPSAAKTPPSTTPPTPGLPATTLPSPLTNLSWKFNPEARNASSSNLKPKLRPKMRAPHSDAKKNPGVGSKSDTSRCSVRSKTNAKANDRNKFTPSREASSVENIQRKQGAQEALQMPETSSSRETLTENQNSFLLSTALIREAQRTSRSMDPSEDVKVDPLEIIMADNLVEQKANLAQQSDHGNNAGDVNNNQIGYEMETTAVDTESVNARHDGQYSYKVVPVREEPPPLNEYHVHRANQVLIQDEWIASPEQQQQMVAKEYQYHLQTIDDPDELNEPTNEYHREIRQLLRKLNVAQSDKPESAPDILQVNSGRVDSGRFPAGPLRKTPLSSSAQGVSQDVVLNQSSHLASDDEGSAAMIIEK